MEESIRTADRQCALAFLEQFLESPEHVNAGIQKAGDTYTIEVSRPTDDCASELSTKGATIITKRH
jgi:hypothetical protein